MTREEIESCIQTLRFLENTFLDDHGIFLNDKHPDNIEKIIIFLHESSVTPKGVTVTDFADRCKECGAEYEKLLEASKPKPGYWVSHNEHCEELGVKPSGLGAYIWCSNCDCGVDIDEFHRNHYNFCPNCGADMRVTRESKKELYFRGGGRMKIKIVPVHIYTHSIYPEKPVQVEGSEHKHNVISFRPGVKLDIPGVEFGYDIETRDFLYKKDGGEWTPMSKGGVK